MPRIFMLSCGRILLLAFLFLNLVACGTRIIPMQGHVEDLSRLPQDVFAYIDKASLNEPLLSDEAYHEANERSTELFFRPWHVKKASVPKSDVYMVLGTDPKNARPRGRSSNLLPWTKKAWQALIENAAPSSYPSLSKRAITVRPTSVRDMPTTHPRFGNPQRAGQGYPFDMSQYSALHLGMPLLAIHQSQDGAWYYVETALVSGWIPAQDIAFVDDAFVAIYESKALIVIVDDNVSFFDASGAFLTQAQMGAYLPEAQIPKAHASFEVLIPIRKPNGSAILVPSHVSVAQASMKPAPLTPYTLATLAMRVMNHPYGWGGMYADRDCSSLLRDMFLVTGVWLPRNSSAQAKAWKYIPFGNTPPPTKKDIIEKQGRPFTTLLWLRGHIALYLGEHEGEPVMLHSMWGLRTMNKKQEGRHVIGRVVITTTQPGLELPNLAKGSTLLERMQGMSVL